jgi:hypothetical protein
LAIKDVCPEASLLAVTSGAVEEDGFDHLRMKSGTSPDVPVVISTCQFTSALCLNTDLDRRLRTFYREKSTDDQGYALIEYAQKEEAEKAIKETSGTTFLEKTIHA